MCVCYRVFQQLKPALVVVCVHRYQHQVCLSITVSLFIVYTHTHKSVLSVLCSVCCLLPYSWLCLWGW